MSQEQISLLSFASQNQLHIKSNDLQLSINQNNTKKQSNTHLEYLLAGLATCINKVGHEIADDLDMDLKSIQIEIKGTINTTLPNHFETIDLVVKPITTADLSTLKFWMDEIKERCPIYNTLLSSTPINLVVTKDYTQKVA